jgi:hypothetical protein
MKNFYKKIEVPIFGGNIHVCIYPDVDKANKLLAKKGLNLKLNKDDLNRGAIAIMDFDNPDFGGVIIFSHEEVSHGVIAHEVDHIVHDLLKSVGMKRTHSSDEAYSHLQEYLVTNITKVIKNKGIKISI